MSKTLVKRPKTVPPACRLAETVSGRVRLATALAVLVGVSACSREKPKMNDDLAKDLAVVSSGEGIDLAPSTKGRQTVSTVEQVAPHTRVASSQPTAKPHRVRHVDPVAPQVAPQPVTVSPEPTPEPVAVATRPAPVEIPAPAPNGDQTGTGGGAGPAPSDGSGSSVGRGPGPGIGIAIGILGTILRGGVVDGDHCDPRAGRRGGIWINRNSPILRGTI